MSLLDPTSCLFVKAVVAELFSHDNGVKKESKETFKIFTGRINRVRYDTVKSLFPNYDIPFKKFTDKFPAVLQSFKWIGKKDPKMRDKILKTFSKTSWYELSAEEKEKHSLFDCKHCQKNHINYIKEFPIKNKLQQAKLNKILDTNNIGNITAQNVKNLNEEYKSNYGTTFTKEVKKILFPNSDPKAKSKFATALKNDMQNQMGETSLDR